MKHNGNGQTHDPAPPKVLPLVVPFDANVWLIVLRREWQYRHSTPRKRWAERAKRGSSSAKDPVDVNREGDHLVALLFMPWLVDVPETTHWSRDVNGHGNVI